MVFSLSFFVPGFSLLPALATPLLLLLLLLLYVVLLLPLTQLGLPSQEHHSPALYLAPTLLLIVLFSSFCYSFAPIPAPDPALAIALAPESATSSESESVQCTCMFMCLC